uniref:Uncharacterized protein n=1 Tax=Onchocerca volvulus TaxID=6282 RepID=A0A8R1TJ05_ONCVO
MDDNEYLTIKYKIYLKNDETSSLLSSSILRRQSYEEEQGTFQTKSTEYDDDTFKKDQSLSMEKLQNSKYKALSSNQQSNQAPIRTSSIETNIGHTQSANKSSQTNYFKDMDPCDNCSNLLIRAAEFLTKIELNYGLKPMIAASSFDTFNQYTTSLSKNIRQLDRRSMSDISRTTTSVPKVSVNSIRSSSAAALLIKQKDKSNRNLNSLLRKKADKSDKQNASQIEEDTFSSFEWMLSSKEQGKRKKTKEKFGMGKSTEEKKAGQDKIIKNETNIEPKLVENREKGQKKLQKIDAGNRLMILDNAKVDTTVAEKMRPEMEKTDEIAVTTSKLKGISKSDRKKTSDDEKETNINKKEVDKKVTRK